MDVQRHVVSRFPDPDYLPRLTKAIDAARTAGVPVIYVVVRFRPGAPEVSRRNRVFGALAGSPLPAGDDAMQIHPDVAPATDDIIVTKKRISAFAGSDLEMVRQASDLDFTLTVLSDGCLDGDPEVHRVLTEKVFPRQADVVTIEEWASTLAR
jgi:nicotinamidase-related amidase